MTQTIVITPEFSTTITVQASEIEFEVSESIIVNDVEFVIATEFWGSSPDEPVAFAFEDSSGRMIIVENDR